MNTNRFVLRSACKKDAKAVYQLALEATTGITTLPQNLKLLKARLEFAELSFQKRLRKPKEEDYFFVLEDCEDQKIVGTSAVVSQVGASRPFYSYQVKKELFSSQALHIHKHHTYLKLKKIKEGPSEICTLFLSPESRRGGLGKLLSLGRFLFMANFPERFKSRIIAEMRGFCEEGHYSPFWEIIGRAFYEINFHKADSYSSYHFDWIKDLIPQQAIYLDLLPKKIYKYLARPHPNTEPALNLLFGQGFAFDPEIDIFDGGPKLSCLCKQVHTISSSQLWTVSEIIPDLPHINRYLLSTTSSPDQFRCCMGYVAPYQGRSLVIDSNSAHLLKIKKGQTLRTSPLTQKKEVIPWKKAYSLMVNGWKDKAKA